MTYEAYSDTLQCHWRAWQVTGPRQLTLHLEACECASMNGAIKIAKLLMPNVNHIITFAGGVRDMQYFVEPGKWEAAQ